jgi:basic membrane protein A
MLRDEYGADIAYTDTVAQADMEAIMREYAKAGYDVVFGHGYEFADALSKVSEEYPDTDFVQINGAIAREPNLYSLGFRTGEGGYLCGLTAGQITESGTVGVIVGTQFPAMDLEISNFHKALEDLGREDIEVLEAYVGSWDDPATAKELATAQIEAGADVLLMVSDAGDAGGIEAAQEAYDDGLTNIRVISWTSDKNYMAPDIVLGGWEQSIPDQMRKGMEAIAGGATGAHYAFGMADGVTWWNPVYGLVPPEVEESVIKARDDYLNGDLEIETNDNI